MYARVRRVYAYGVSNINEFWKRLNGLAEISAQFKFYSLRNKKSPFQTLHDGIMSNTPHCFSKQEQVQLY